jgi:hypothetical protein
MEPTELVWGWVLRTDGCLGSQRCPLML